MKIEILYMNHCKCYLHLTGVQQHKPLYLWYRDKSGKKFKLKEFLSLDDNFHVMLQNGFDSIHVLESTFFTELENDDTDLEIKLPLLDFLVSRQTLHSMIYRDKPEKVEKVAVVTMVYDEKFILEKWVAYYGRQVGFDNLYVINDGSSINPADYLPKEVNVINQPRKNFSDFKKSRILSLFHHFLLETYDLVIVVDTDEFIVVADERHQSLGIFLKNLDIRSTKRLRPIGWDLVHLRSVECDLNQNIPIVLQRKALLRASAYDKVSILSEPTSLHAGQHSSFEVSEYLSSLMLIHFRYFDYGHSCDRLKQYRSIELKEYDDGIAMHNTPWRYQTGELDKLFLEFDEKFSSSEMDQEKMFMSEFIKKQLNI